MKRKAVWWLRVGLLALAGASGCVRCSMAPKEPCPCECQTPHRFARRSCECGTPCASSTPYLSCAADKPQPAPAAAAPAAKAPATAAAPAAPTAPPAKPMQLPPLPTPTSRAPAAPPAGTVPLPELKPSGTAMPKSLPEVTKAPAKPTPPTPAALAAVTTRPTPPAKPATPVAPAPAAKAPLPPAAATTPVASKPKVRLILTGTEAAPAKPAAPAAGPPMPSHLPDLDLPAPAPAEAKPAARANVKDEEGPLLFPDEPAKPSEVELATAKSMEGSGRAVHAYLPAQAKPDLPALKPVPPPAVPQVVPTSTAPKAPARPLRLPDPPQQERLLFPRTESGPVRRSYTDVTAAPCFGHGPDYGWLCGRVEYSRLSKGWRLRYASVDEADRYGGSVTLVADPKLDALKDGQYVRITGRLADRPPGLSPEYEVESVTPVQHPNAPQKGGSEACEF